MCKRGQVISESFRFAEKEWRLSDISCIYETKDKGVYCANAAEWGNVMVKISTDKNALANEFYALTALGGEGCCKAYALDKIHGIMIEERIYPGNTLREEQNLPKRIEEFCTVFHKVHADTGGVGGYDTYIDWLKKANAYLEENGTDGEIKKGMQAALQIGEELFDKYRERILLHGDMHHDNILAKGESGYCIIDPKGVSGPPIFDMARFILNEYDYVSIKKAGEHLETVIGLMEKGTGYCAQDMKKLLFMETMLANVWCMEDGEGIDIEKIKISASIAYGG